MTKHKPSSHFRFYHALIFHPDIAKEYFSEYTVSTKEKYQPVHDILKELFDTGEVNSMIVEKCISIHDVKRYIPDNFYNMVLFEDTVYTRQEVTDAIRALHAA